MYFPFNIEQSLFSLTCDTFVVYSYKYQHDDGRVSYPLCFIFSSPVGVTSGVEMTNFTFNPLLL